MNIFLEHPRQQGVTYFSHMLFALNIAFRLFQSVIAFALHGIFPFIDISKDLDLEETGRFIYEQNRWIEGMKRSGFSEDMRHLHELR